MLQPVSTSLECQQLIKFSIHHNMSLLSSTLHCCLQSSQVVEERRQRLQDHLRYIFKLCSTQALMPSAKAKEKSIAQQAQPIFPLSIPRLSSSIDLFPFFKWVFETFYDMLHVSLCVS
jgi:hypothetical protein